MKQDLKSQLSRQKILDSGLELFSSKGYRATSIKDIAKHAEISVGRLYHHFQTKLEIFTHLLDDYWKILADPEQPLNKLILQASFPDDIPQLAQAIRLIVEENSAYIMLIYIDVIEFRGEHINRIYSDMADNFRAAYSDRFDELKQSGRLNENADPLFAVMMTYRFFFHYYLVENSFGVKDHFGFSGDAMTEKASELILHGLLARNQNETHQEEG